MCGDLDDYDPGKHVELLLDGLKAYRYPTRSLLGLLGSGHCRP